MAEEKEKRNGVQLTALEAVFVATLLAAHLTVEFQLLEALRLRAVGNVLGGSFLGLGHSGNDVVIGIGNAKPRDPVMFNETICSGKYILWGRRVIV
jgi:hypothetical protein